MESNNEKKFRCEDCDINYKYRHTLNNHLLKKHNIKKTNSGSKNIKCKICDKKFTQMQSMTRHMKTLHSSKDVQPKTDTPHLEELLPGGYDYEITEYIDLEPGQFIVKFSINNFGTSDVKSWILELGEKSKITFLSTSVRVPKMPGIIFKKRYRCHHNTRPKKNSKPSEKHYDCKATLGLQIVSDPFLSDELKHSKQFGTSSEDNNQTKALVLLKHIHNHGLLKADVLKHRIPSDEIKAKFLKLFEDGKSPSKALFLFKSNLRNEKGNNSNRQTTNKEADINLISENNFSSSFDTCQNINISDDFEEAMNQLDGCYEKMKEACNSDKAYFLPAIKSFVKSMNTHIKTHAGLCSAMETFGKYSGINPQLKQPQLIGVKKIGTQPTAIARRRTRIGGRKNLTAGRTPKWRRVTEHGYANKITSGRLPLKKHKPFDPTQLPSKVMKTPHSLLRCVEINKALGATHSSK